MTIDKLDPKGLEAAGMKDIITITAPLTVQVHLGNPRMARIPELTIRPMPECEGGGWYMPADQAQAIVDIWNGFLAKSPDPHAPLPSWAQLVAYWKARAESASTAGAPGETPRVTEAMPIYWKHAREHGLHYAVKQLHFPDKGSALGWVCEHYPHELNDAMAGWADDALAFDRNIWSDLPTSVATPTVSVDLMQRVWRNLYFNEREAGYTFQSTLDEVVDWLSTNNALPPDPTENPALEAVASLSSPPVSQQAEAVAWPEPQISNPDIANPTGVPYLDCLLHRLLDAQQDINLEANGRMSQPLCDASALFDEIESCIRKLTLRSALVAAPAPDAEVVAVAWQWRGRAQPHLPWSEWREGRLQVTCKDPAHGFEFEERKLYASPAPDAVGPSVKALEWERIGDGFYRAPAPLFGNIRVEKYGARFSVCYSVPGYSNTFVEGAFATADEAKAHA